MKLEKPSGPGPKPGTSPDSGMLAPSEVEELRRDRKEAYAYAQKAFKKNPLV